MLDRIYDRLDLLLLREVLFGAGVEGEPLTTRGTLPDASRRALRAAVSDPSEWCAPVVVALWNLLNDELLPPGEELLERLSEIVVERALLMGSDLRPLLEGQQVMTVEEDGLDALRARLLRA